ncbi:HD-GYP domain-containing protein, partial [bacterium]
LEALRESEADRKPFEASFRLSPRLGEERHVEGKGVPILNEVGEVGRMIAYFFDVTDTRRAEAEVRDKQESLESANRLLRETLMDLEANFQAMVQAFVKVVEAKDPYTAGHSERVMAYAMWMGEAMGLRPDELRTLRMGCLVHDVGKIGVPDSILTKPDSLNDFEFAAIRQHPSAGVRIIEHIPLFNDCVPIVRHHHERLDGTGYPDRLKGDEIGTLVRIAAVADCFDAMTSTRAYRNGMDVERAMRELRKDAERGALDPTIVETFDEIVRREGVLWTPMSRAA